MESSAWLAFQSVRVLFSRMGHGEKPNREKKKEEWGGGGPAMSFRVAKSEVELVNGPIDGITIKILWFAGEKWWEEIR